MAWANVGLTGSTGNASNNQSTIVITLNKLAGAGANEDDILIAAFGMDNFSSVSNADEGAVTSVTDSSSNTWVKAREITNGNATSTLGTVCSVWWSRIDTAISTAGTVTANLSNNTARDGVVGLIQRFTASGGVDVAASTYLTAISSAQGSIDQTMPTATEYLRFRAFSARTTVTAMSTTAGWTSIGTTRGSATKTLAIFGEYRIISATTAASAPSITANVTNANIYVVFEENNLLATPSL